MNNGFISKAGNYVKTKIAPAANMISKQKHVSAIKNGLIATVPMTILGGFSLILAQPPVNPKTIETVNFFTKFLIAWKEWSVAHAVVLNIPYNMTMGLLGLYAVFTIAYGLAKSYKMNALMSGFTGLVAYLIVCAPAIAANPEAPKALFLATDFLGAKGLFTAILIGIFSVEITRLLFKKNVRIKMPDSVPPMVSAPFESLIPLVINVVLFMAINQLLIMITGMNIPKLILVLFMPLISASDTLSALIIIALLVNVLWFFGIHGGAIANAVILPFCLLNVAENAAAITAGQTAPHIFSGLFYIEFINIGGAGAALGMAIVILIFAKSAQLKSISKVGIIPSLFNISEPFVFGTPMIMNPYLFIPMILAPLVNAVFAYIVSSLHIIGRVYVYIPFTMPGPVAAFLATMDWKAVVFWFVLLVVDIMIYIPFIKGYDRVLYRQEQEAQTAT